MERLFHFFPRVNLRLKFIALFVLTTLIPLLIVTSVVTLRFRQIQEENTVNLDTHIAQAAAEEVEAFIVNQFTVLSNLGTLYPDFLPSDFKTAQLLLRRFFLHNENFTDITFVDERGKEVVRENTLFLIRPEDVVDADHSRNVEFTTVRETGYYVGPVELVNGRPFFTIGRSIKGLGGVFRGAIFGQVDARVMQNVVKRISSVGKTGRAYIVNTEGIVIAHPDISAVLAQRDMSFLPSVAFLLQRPARGNPLSSYQNETGEEVIGAGVPITLSSLQLAPNELKTGWFVVVEQPSSVALAAVRQVDQFTRSTLVLVFLISIFASFLFVNRIVSPVERLHRVSKQFGQGHFEERVSIHTNDELEDLGNAFNAMAENLEKSIAALKENAQVIAAERDKLEVVLSGISDAIVGVDTHRKIISFNKAAERMTGYSTSEALGKPIDTLISVFDKEHRVSASEYCPECPKAASAFEGVVYNKRGLKIVGKREAFGNLISGKIKGGERVNLGCILALHDITAERELEEMKLDFVSMAAHELRTPVTTIKGYLSVFVEENQKLLNDEQKMFLQRVNISTEQLMGLIDNLLNVTRIERGVLTMNVQPLDWPLIVSETVKEFASRAEDKHIILSYEAPQQEIPPLHADKIRVTEVLSNLLSNAISYTPENGKVTVKVESEGKEVLTQVKDTGRGIPHEALPRLFTKFFRLPTPLAEGSKGMGLGLYIAKSIIEMHKGKIWVESGVGKGSTFSFSLPFTFESSKDVEMPLSTLVRH